MRSFGTVLVVLASVLLLGVAPPAFAEPAPRGFSVAEAPAWLAPTSSPAWQAAKPDPHGAIRWLLLEGQTRVEGDTVIRYRRQVRQVLDTAGVQEGSELRITFEPTFQNVTLHHVRLHRDGEVVDALRPEEIKVLQRERELDAGIYSGHLTLVAFLRDVRAGDIVDAAWSVEGQHPTLVGQLTEAIDLGAPFPVERLYHRLVVPRDLRLSLRTHQSDARPRVRELEETREYVWDLEDVRSVDTDDRVPAWFDPWPWAQVSSFASWADVVRWALPLYAVADVDENGDENGGEASRLAARVEEIARTHASAEARLLAATRLVEHEVRYLGMEVGAASLRPRPPEEVLAQRYGDCKDKSLLLVSLLRNLGIEAAPALVHSYLGPSLDGLQPSPAVFNHVIVRATVGGRDYWIDTTEGRTRIDLEDLSAPPLARALVLREGEDALRVVPSAAPREPEVEVKERYRLTRADRPAVLEVETIYRGAAADGQRRRLRSTTRARMEKNALNFYAKHDDDISLSKPLSIEDDRKRNVIVIHERYRIPGFWDEGGRLFHAWAITSRLRPPVVVRRTAPLAIAHPSFVRHELVVQLPEVLEVENADFETQDGALHFTFQARYEPRVLTLSYDLKTLRDHVKPEDTTRHLATLDAIQERARYFLGERMGAPRGDRLPAPDEAGDEEMSDEEALWFLGGGCGCCSLSLCASAGLGFLGGLLVP